MKKTASWIITLCFIFSGLAFAETKDETMLKKIPSLGASFSETSKNIKKYEDVQKEIEKEQALIKKNNLGIEEGREMTQEEAMARYGGMGQQMSMADIQMVQPIQQTISYMHSDYMKEVANISTEISKLDANMQADLEKVRLNFDDKFLKINDGEGSTAADIKKWENLNREYMAAQVKVVDSFLPKKKKLLDEYRAKLGALMAKAAPVYTKAFSTTKNSTVLMQATTLRMNVLGSMNSFLEVHLSVATWKPQNRSRVQ